MRRIDLVLIKLKELKDSNSNGASAIDIAQMLNLDRANVSKDLNKLATQEKVIKTKGKPTLFKINDGYNKNQTNNGESKEIKEHNVNDTSIMDIFLEKIRVYMLQLNRQKLLYYIHQTE